jgi:hypothetical protein
LNDYDDDYFILARDSDNDRIPFLTPDTSTAQRRFYYEPIPPGSAPLIFYNGYKNEFREGGIKEDIADVLFAGSNFVVRDHIRERLLQYPLPGVTIHPAVYIDDENQWHEDFWFVAFESRFDCWDRVRTDYDRDPMEIAGEEFYSINKYALDEEVLDRTPLENRLLFQMGGTDVDLAFCHKSLAPLFRQNGNSGAAVIALRDY